MNKGTLVIAGGEVKASTVAIFTAYVDAAGGPDKRFAMVPSATKNPEASFAKHKRILIDLGVPEANIRMLEVSALRADWMQGARDPAQLEIAGRSDAFWIYGGDQNAIIAALLEPDGTDTPLLRVMRERLAAGGVIGGSSAGAAIMSDVMIGAGTSFGAFALPRVGTASGQEISDAVLVRQGLSFFEAGIIDQHFETRARLGRLVDALLVEGGGRRPGFGVAEDTALVVRLANGAIELVGSGGMYVVRVEEASSRRVDGRKAVDAIRLSYLCEGDIYSLETGTSSFPGKKEILPGEEYYAVDKPISSGVLSGYGRLAEFISNFVVDNDPACLFFDAENGMHYAKSYLMGMNPESDGRLLAWEVRMGRKQGLTKGWIGSTTAFQDIIVDILPVTITVE